jgi:hypothetical protein
MAHWRRQIVARKNLILLASATLLLAVPMLPPAAPMFLSPASTPAIAEGGLVDGDLVFRRGRDMMAATVLAADRAARFSHVGLLLHVDGRAMIVHAVPSEEDRDGGVVIEPLAAFLAPDRASDYAVYRVRALDNAGRRRLTERALAMVGRPFDFELRWSDDGRLYCSELVLKALEAAGFNLRPGLPTVQTVMMPEPAIAPDSLRGSRTLLRISTNPAG